MGRNRRSDLAKTPVTLTTVRAGKGQGEVQLTEKLFLSLKFANERGEKAAFQLRVGPCSARLAVWSVAEFRIGFSIDSVHEGNGRHHDASERSQVHQGLAGELFR